ncbi:MAG: hypothetical protein RLZZ337_1999, partial [Bacteroidota bacterium]
MYSINSKIGRLNWWQKLSGVFSDKIYKVEQNKDLDFYNLILNEVPQLICIKNKEG